MHSVWVSKTMTVHPDIDSRSTQLSAAITERKMPLTTAELSTAPPFVTVNSKHTVPP